ncbi:MAG: N-acetyl sugar amidotransferase [Candidatus Riflebacteria bacterium]|nr:N-acetyl sugar amidotransferase [Candidatus Riflebacteria bacterium]
MSNERQGAPGQVCSRCLMDTTAQGISFNEAGVCSYCREYEARVGRPPMEDDPATRQRREAFLERVRKSGRGRKYDCVVGVSGGVDSSYALWQAVQCGLRPLAVHMDNGWDSELAQSNIENLVRRLGVDLFTHVIDWEEYRGLQRAFLDADVLDVELLYDNAMLAVNYQQASRFGVEFILSGMNQATEGVVIPRNWNWFKNDKANILGIWKAKGEGRPLKTFPLFGTWDYLYYTYVRRIAWVCFLDFFPYRKAQALEDLSRELGFRPYSHKHYESVFTRFYQGFLLPRKFGVDKRKAHFSTLIMSGQMTREVGWEMLQGSPYQSEKELQEDTEFFLKKIGWTRADFEDYLQRPERAHDFYPSERKVWDFLARWKRKLGW